LAAEIHTNPTFFNGRAARQWSCRRDANARACSALR
jgi:hypothetical protein